MCVGLSLGFLSCSIDPYVYFLPIPCCLDYCSFVVLSEVWEGYASSFVLFPQHWFYGLLWFYINFRIICSSSVKYVMGNLKGITLNLQIALGTMAILTILILLVQENGLSFPDDFFKSSSISFFSVLYKSFTSLVRFIPKYFYFFDSILKGIVFL